MDGAATAGGFLAHFWTTIICSLGLCLVFASAKLPTFHQPLKGDGSLSFLVLGDWGRRGAFNQSEVAAQMGRIGEKLDVDFVVSTGDNFYDNGLTSEEDTAFEESFTRIYTAKSLQKQWYSVLGNHDYRGNVEAQLSHHLREIDGRWVCLRSFIVDAELAEIFLVDTTPFVISYFTKAKGHTYDWRHIPSRKAYISNLLEDLEFALEESTARWKIVVGHHPIRSIGHHGDTEELVRMLLPVLRANDVDFYINGHDHCLEHMGDTERLVQIGIVYKNNNFVLSSGTRPVQGGYSRIQFLTSGAGSKAWRGDIMKQNRDGLKFFYDGQGFMSLHLTETDAEIVFYDVSGNILHRWITTKSLLRSSI